MIREPISSASKLNIAVLEPITLHGVHRLPIIHVMLPYVGVDGFETGCGGGHFLIFVPRSMRSFILPSSNPITYSFIEFGLLMKILPSRFGLSFNFQEMQSVGRFSIWAFSIKKELSGTPHTIDCNLSSETVIMA